MARGKRVKPVDPRPYIGDSGRKVEGAVDAITVTSAMVLLALSVGFVVGFLVFLVMNLSTWLTGLIWNGYLDGSVGLAWFPLAVCTGGGLVIGLWTYFTDSRIESLQEVMATFKQTGTYQVNPVKGAVSFLLPLVFGGSIGFEAGLTGLITAGCCWIRDKLKAAGLREASVADVTIAASLAAIFGNPLAGIVAGAESEHDDAPNVNDYNMRRSSKLVLYTSAAFWAFAGIAAFSSIFGSSSGLPHFGEVHAQGTQFLWVLAAIVVAYALIWAYHGAQFLFRSVSERAGESVIPTIAKPVVAGLVMGAVACAFPYVMFPGETQTHQLMENWQAWTALALIATGLLKAVITPMCLNMGWVGGNFCPSIFAGAACGYGVAMITGADPTLMVVVVVTAFLSGVLRAPLLTVAILLVFFPLEAVVWMGLAAVVGSVLPIPRFLLAASAEDAGAVE